MRFAERGLCVERILDRPNVNRRWVRVLFILSAADRPRGVTQSQLVKEMDLHKDVISKLVKSMLRAKLLNQTRAIHNRQIKILTAAGDGKDILAEIKAALKLAAAK